VFVSQGVLTALEPAALTRSLEATTRLEPERQALDRLWPQRAERAAYASEWAARHDRLVAPEHRLVARQLAKDREGQLTAQRHLHEEYERVVQVQPRPLSRTEREAIEPLAHSMPALWQAPTTTMAARQEMVRQLIQRVMGAGEETSARLQSTLVWVGGRDHHGAHHAPHEPPRARERCSSVV
jgi:hypothetical protein